MFIALNAIKIMLEIISYTVRGWYKFQEIRKVTIYAYFHFINIKKSNFMQIKFKKFDRIIVRIFFFITAPLGSGKVN